MTALWKTDQLYPPDKPEDTAVTRKLLDAVLTEERTPSGKHILRRQFDVDERADLEHRLKVLEPWTVRPNPDRIEPLLLELFVRFDVRETPKESAIRVKAFTQMLVDTPLWAIKRACDRFSQGLVTPEEIKERSILRGRPPTTAHLHLVAAGLVRPIYYEIAQLKKALAGQVVRRGVLTETQRAEFKARQEAREKQTSEAAALEATRKAIAGDEARARLADANIRILRGEYEKAGVDVPLVPGGMLVSLGTLLSLGYRIEEIAGRKQLTAPRRA